MARTDHHRDKRDRPTLPRTRDTRAAERTAVRRTVREFVTR